MSGPWWSEDELKEAQSLHAAGMDFNEIGRQLGKSAGGVRMKLRASGSVKPAVRPEAAVLAVETIAPTVLVRIHAPGKLPLDQKVTPEVARQVLALIAGI